MDRTTAQTGFAPHFPLKGLAEAQNRRMSWTNRQCQPMMRIEGLVLPEIRQPRAGLALEARRHD